jgi:DNA-directed RNA polymerase specialized sigma24 family protein
MPTTAPSAVAETVSDEALLQRFAERREPDAFKALAERHAGLVFGACLRITADRHDAEELTQDCFLQLARKASTVRSSVAGWLTSSRRTGR